MHGALPDRMRHAFRALRHRQFRVYWIGQGVSVAGTWMQTVAQSWLVYRLTDSPLMLGLLTAARFGPSLVGSPFAGVVTDRFPRRSLVLLTQTLSLLQASVMAALTLTGRIRVWHVLLLAAFQGVVDTLDMPARQTLQVDLVGIEDLQSAVALNSSVFNAARIVGPGVAGVLVAAFGEGICFAVNAASYLAVLVALLAIRLPAGTGGRAGSLLGELAEGVSYAWHAPRVRASLTAVAVTSMFGLSYSTLLPVLARDVFHGGVKGYGVLLAAAGLGAIAGALGAGARRGAHSAERVVALGQATLGLGLVALALAHTIAVAVGWMVLVGLGVAAQLSTTNGFLQTAAPPHLRGRVVSLYIWLFAGMSPVGGLLAGWAAERVGATWTAVGAGAACLASALATAVEIGARGRALPEEMG